MVTIRDVAQAAGVSIATVSRVFSGGAHVRHEVAQRVRTAATRLDYWPHSGARSLTTSRAHALGVLLPDLFGDFFSEVLHGIDRTAREAGHQILVSSSHADTETMLAAARAMRGRIDGLIAMVPDKGSATGIRQIAQRFPVVLVNPRFPVQGCSTVSVANFEGAYDVVAHLIEAGHRRIAILKGPAGNVDADERLRGYRRALADAGVRSTHGLEFQGDFSQSSGFEIGRTLVTGSSRPTAVFAANDYMAIGFLSALRDAALRVPDDVAVVGFDDIPMARFMSPPLTTVHLSAEELGRRATRALFNQLRSTSDRAVSHSVLEAQLVVRESCGASRAIASPAKATRNGRPRRGSRKAGNGSHVSEREAVSNSPANPASRSRRVRP